MRQKETKRIKVTLLLLVIIGALLWWQRSQLTKLITDIQAWPSTIHMPWVNPNNSNQDIAYSFAILSDSHQDTQYFPDIVSRIANQPNLAFVADLGDLTNAGDKTKLQQAKDILAAIKPTVYVLPGDHDFNWFPNHDLTNFKQVFQLKKTYYSFNKGNQHFIFIDNSDLNNGISQSEWQWLQADLDQHAKQDLYVFMSTPLSNPYLSFKAMGSQNQTVKDQSAQLGQLLKQYQVKAIFAGDTHVFAQYTDKDSGLPIVAVGAAGSTKNLLPLYVIVDIFTDGSYNATSQPYKHAISVTGSD